MYRSTASSNAGRPNEQDALPPLAVRRLGSHGETGGTIAGPTSRSRPRQLRPDRQLVAVSLLSVRHSGCKRELMNPFLGIETALVSPISLGVGWLVARLLGVRQTWSGILVTGLIGWILGVALANWSVVNHPGHEATLEVRVAAFSVLATMATSNGIDFLAKPSRRDRYERIGRIPRIPRPIQRPSGALAAPLRLREVVDLARQEGLLQRRFASAVGVADPDFGPRLRGTLERSGAIFVMF